MKHFVTLLSALLLSFTVMAATAPDYSKLPSHPRLILKSGDIDAVRQKVDTDQPLQVIHKHIAQKANRTLREEAIERKMTGKRLLSCSRTVLERVCYCSYMYLVSKDATYAKRAEKEMLSAARYTDWNPKHFLDVGEMTAALAIGYDWLYDLLSPESRKVIEDAIIEKGLRAVNKKMWWLRSDNNWNQVCNSGLVMGALAVYERCPELAQAIVAQALESNPKAQTAYGPSGVYPEGFGYWEYGTWYEVLLIESLRTALGRSLDLEKAPGFVESARFMNFMVTPTGGTFNFSDCGNQQNAVNPLLYWFALESGDTSILWQDRKRILEKKRIRGLDRLTPIAMLFASRCNTTEIKPIEEKVWIGNGEQPLFLYRSGFEKSTDCYLGVKGGTAKSNHAHMDAGTFIYEWGGVRWAMDLGSQSYYSLEKLGIKIWNKGQDSDRWSVFRLNNFSHNTLSVNNELHNYDGKATIEETYNSDNKYGAKLNLSDIFFDLKSAHRTIYIDNGGKVSCIDEVTAGNKKCKIRWNMTTPATAEIRNKKTITLEKDGKRVILRASSANAKAYIMSNEPTTEYDCQNKGTCRVGFEFIVPTNKNVTLKVELTPQK